MQYSGDGGSRVSLDIFDSAWISQLLRMRSPGRYEKGRFHPLPWPGGFPGTERVAKDKAFRRAPALQADTGRGGFQVTADTIPSAQPGAQVRCRSQKIRASRLSSGRASQPDRKGGRLSGIGFQIFDFVGFSMAGRRKGWICLRGICPPLLLSEHSSFFQATILPSGQSKGYNRASR